MIDDSLSQKGGYFLSLSLYLKKAVEEEDGKKSLLKAELENVLGKPKDKVVVSSQFLFFRNLFEL